MTQKIFISLFFSLFCLCNTLVNAANVLSEYAPTASVFLFQKKMASKGSAAAQYKLGTMYETGTGIPANLSTAVTWYKKAAKQHYKAAQNRLIFLDITKNGFTKQHQQWLKILRHDARFGDGEALFLLAQLYNVGVGVKQNKPLALKLLKKAAAADIAGAEKERVKLENISPQKNDPSLPKAEQKIAVKKEKKNIQSPPTLRKQLQTQQKKLQQNIIKQQRKAFLQRYRQLKATQIKPLKTSLPLTIKPAEVKTINNINKTICSGSNRFMASCR